MKKISLLLLLAVTLAFAGCSNDDKEKTHVLDLPTYATETLYMGDFSNPVKTWEVKGDGWTTNYIQTLLTDNSKLFEFDCISTKEYGFGSDAFGFTNATSGNYSAVTKKGVSNGTYVVVGAAGYEDVVIRFKDDEATSSKKYDDYIVKGLYITNSVFAYNSMKNGDAFIGDPFKTNDWYKVTIYNADKSQKIEVTLAEGTNLLTEWKWVDLTSLGETTGLSFSISGSRNNDWGITIPTYFCLDGITLSEK